MNKTLVPYELHGDSGFHFETQNIFIDLQDVSKRNKILGGAGPYVPLGGLSFLPRLAHRFHQE
jgi:hypothetical protein